MAIFHGTKHDDNLTGTSGDDTFDLYKGGEDTASGGSGDDVFNMGASLDSGDRIDGGADRDTLFLHGDYSAGVIFDDQTIQNIEVLRLGAGFDYNLTLADGNVAAGGKLTINAFKLGAGDHLVFDGSAETDGRFAVYGGAGNDTITGGARADIFHLEKGGNDTVHGGGGGDTFYLGDTFTRDDVIDGGAGHDTVVLEGMGDDAIGFTAATMTGVETLVLGAGHFYTLTTDDATVAAGATLTVDATALGAGDPLIFNGSNETDGNFVFAFGGGFTTTDTITGGAGNDTLSFDGAYASLALSSTKIASLESLAFTGAHAYTGVAVTGDIAGGSALTIDASTAASLSVDLGAATSAAYTITGSGGADTFKFGSNFSASDVIDGGAGNDTLEIGSTSGVGITFTADTMTNIETLKIDGSVNLVLNDGNVAAGATLTVDASVTTSALEVDGSAETDGAFAFIAGHAVGNFTGGAGNDFFDISLESPGLFANQQGNGGNDTFLYAANFSFNHTIVGGGAGSDTLEFNGTYTSLAPLSGHLASIETLKFLGNHSYTGVAFTGDIADGSTLTIDASAASNISINLSAATSAAYAITGSAGADAITFGSNFSVSDSIDGGAGNDTLTLTNIHGTFTFTDTTIQNVDDLVVTLSDGTSGTVITTTDKTVAAGATMIVDFSHSGPLFGVNFTFNGSAEQDGHFNFIAPATVMSDISVTGGAQSDTFLLDHPATGTSRFHGLGGDDTATVNANGSALQFDGGADNDTLAVTGGGSFNYANTAAWILTSVENLQLDDNGYFITLNNVSFGAAETLNVDATALTGSHTLTFSGTGTTLVNYVFDFAGNFTASDSLTGGAGSDTLALNGDYSLGVIMGATTISGIETITLADGHSYGLNENDANVAAGATLTVDASALTGSNLLFFSGSNETDGHFAFISSAGADDLEGGAQSDTFDLSRSDGAFALGNGGNDTFTVTSAAHLLDDFIDGGTGTDTLVLNGSGFGTVTSLTGSNLINIETLTLLGAANSYNLAIADAITTSLTVDASATAGLTFSGAGDTSTAFTITGSAGADHIIGGNKGDTITGGDGADIFAYTSVAQSTSTTYDTITDFAAGTDKFDLATTVTGVFSASGSLDSGANFDSELAALNIVHIGGATELIVNGGTLNGHVFLIVDGDGNAQYNAGSDYVFDITGHTGTIGTGDFI